MSITSGQFRYAFPAYRVFIYGVEVTDDTTSIAITQHDGNAPNTCQIQLLNELDKYILTTKDMMNLTGFVGSTGLEQLHIPWLQSAGQLGGFSQDDIEEVNGAAFIDGDTNFQNLINATIAPQRKRDILTRKSKVIQKLQTQIPDPSGGQTTPAFTDYFGSTIKRYPLSDGLPIFHSMDPVRVFFRDPFNPGRWYHMFAGFVSDMVDNTNENNEKVLTIVAEDPTKLFRYTRLVVNPGIADANKIVQNGDLTQQTFNQNFFHNFSLSEIFFTTMFGPEQVQAEFLQEETQGPTKNSTTSTRLRGVGHFSFEGSGQFTFGPPPTQAMPTQTSLGVTDPSQVSRPATQLASIKGEVKLNNLTDWQTIIDHEVQPTDMYVMASDTDRGNFSVINARISSIPLDSDGKLSVSSVISYIGSHPEEYLIDGGRLLMLIPASLGTENNRILTEDIIPTYPMNSQWISVGQMLYEVADRIQFAFYASPRGDIVIEFPMFDFNPDDFGLTQIAPDRVSTPIGAGQNTYTLLAGAQHVAPGRNLGPFGSRYTILRRDTVSWESAVVDEKIHTMAVASKALIQNWESLGYSDLIGNLQIAQLPDLVPLYGVRMAQITPRGYVATDQGATLLANTELNKLNADAHTMNVQFMPNIGMWLNRPIYIQGRNCLGTTKQISHNIKWGMGGDMSTSSDLWALRTWQGQFAETDPHKPVFTTIGGYESRPLNYAILTQTADLPSPSVFDTQTQDLPSQQSPQLKNLSDGNKDLTTKIGSIKQNGDNLQ
jgi:hypothetical protein